jgi:hypothetical protein
MEISYLTKPVNLDPGSVIFKRFLVYFPLIINLFLLQRNFMPLFLEDKVSSGWGWIFKIEHLPEPLSMIAFLLTLITFNRNYVIKQVEVLKAEARLKVTFEGLVPAILNLILAITRITLYIFWSSEVTRQAKIKLLFHGIILMITSSVSIYFSKWYVLDLYGIRLSFYNRLCKFWKLIHTVIVLSLLGYFSLSDSNIIVRSVVRILCLLVCLTLILNLLQKNQTFLKINFVQSLADLNLIFLLISFILYFKLSSVLELRLASKSIEYNFEHEVISSFYLAFAYYLISCRHRLYSDLHPLVTYSLFGTVSRDPLMASAFKQRQKAAVRDVSQFNFFFLKRSFGIFSLTRNEMLHFINGSKDNFWSEILQKNPETCEKLESFIPIKLKTSFEENENKNGMINLVFTAIKKVT